MAKKHYKSLKARGEEHKKDPKTTSCIWSHKDYGGKKGWSTHPCHYQNNGFEESKGGRSGKYVPSQARVDEVNASRKELRESAAAEYRQEVNKAREEVSRYQELRASGEKLAKRDNFRSFVANGRLMQLTTKAREFLQKHILGYGQPLHRLSLNKEAWHVAHVLDESLVTKEYLGGQGYVQARKNGVKQPVNFAPEWHEQRLGSWYPYEHEYHHIIPKGALKYELLDRPQNTPIERRVSVVWESKWNMHNGGNIVLLAENPVIAKIINLPAHCPWGATGHALYSDMVEAHLRQLANQVEADLSEAGEPHEVEKIAGDELRKGLNALSLKLYNQIITNKVLLS
ncbi:AHH domain-containing protein [Melittangium boletus]|uniref:Uncharacterized protein n=1 Tax=Melittangium boletus DSM 14713 TaxID=1294270 RepID=A0A250I8Z7_9BACT|nr:AHH domain-containing protein [Melittangium boletus]ATB27680.1 hypothetical protein MEBOL_001124 [Melittangium boletus DSM 14713]